MDGRLLGVRLAGQTLAQTWLKRAMAEDELGANMIRFALAPTARARRKHCAAQYCLQMC